MTVCPDELWPDPPTWALPACPDDDEGGAPVAPVCDGEHDPLEWCTWCALHPEAARR